MKDGKLKSGTHQYYATGYSFRGPGIIMADHCKRRLKIKIEQSKYTGRKV